MQVNRSASAAMTPSHVSPQAETPARTRARARAPSCATARAGQNPAAVRGVDYVGRNNQQGRDRGRRPQGRVRQSLHLQGHDVSPACRTWPRCSATPTRHGRCHADLICEWVCRLSNKHGRKGRRHRAPKPARAKHEARTHGSISCQATSPAPSPCSPTKAPKPRVPFSPGDCF